MKKASGIIKKLSLEEECKKRENFVDKIKRKMQSPKFYSAKEKGQIESILRREMWQIGMIKSQQKKNEINKNISIDNLNNNINNKNNSSEKIMGKNEEFRSIPVDEKLKRFLLVNKLCKQTHECKQKSKLTPYLSLFDVPKKFENLFSVDPAKIKVASLDSLENLPIEKQKNEIAFAGRSNVGKSALINTIVSIPNSPHKPTISRKPGQTKSLHFIFLPKLTLVDLPGYGYSFSNAENKDRWNEFYESYLGNRSSLKRTFILIDSRIGLKPSDLSLMSFLDSVNKNFQLILTKVDLVEANELVRRITQIKEELKEKKFKNLKEEENLLLVSSKTRSGISRLHYFLSHLINER